MIQAVVFDMDGVLVDSEPVWDAARQAMAAEAGETWDGDDHRAVMGTSTQEWADYMIERLRLTSSPEAVVDEVIERMAAAYAERIPWLPGAIEAVDLAAANYRTALASGAHPTLIDIITAQPAVAGKWEVIISADEVGAGKPAPDIYLAVAKRLGVEPGSCVCVEDSGNGIISGARAGMHVIAVPDPRFGPSDDVLGEADLVLDSLTELSLDAIERIGRRR